MTFEEYSEKNEKSQNASGEEALDDDALNAVAGGVGDVNVDGTVQTNVSNDQSTVTDTTTIKDDHSNHSVVKKHLTTDGSLTTNGKLNF